MPRRDNIIDWPSARPSEWRFLAYGALAGLAFVGLAACQKPLTAPLSREDQWRVDFFNCTQDVTGSFANPNGDVVRECRAYADQLASGIIAKEPSK